MKSYYAIIPADIRYNRNLSANEKLLYGEITALTNEKGYCFASNKYFADLYDVHKNTISRWVSNLTKEGSITVTEVLKIGGITERRIAVSKNVNTPKQKEVPPYAKTFTPLNKNVYHNITVNNTVNNKYNKGASPHSILKGVFIDFYKSKKGEDYYWTAKDAGGLKQLIKKIEFKLKEKDIPVSNEKLQESMNVFLMKISDKWIIENLSISLINSKFNEIISQAKNGTSTEKLFKIVDNMNLDE